ncbi:ribonuclease domain-containing protein [Helicobacter trogontum]|uniref:ribonuclease domain-containing protein n=1 Tax=Helicobacter trogontum TaxID=50960 RepID=UPI000AC4F791|nr:ribonuclease domain-containing protein [Helicobacter trogontum]
MSSFNTKPIHIQVRDVHCNLIENAKIKVIAPNGDILFNEESPNGEIILDDIQKLKNIHRFKVEIEHPHYQSKPKTHASCIRLANLHKPHTLEFPYQTKLLVSNVYAELREIGSKESKTPQQENCPHNNANTICLPTRTYNLDTSMLEDTQAQARLQNISIYLKAYYNQDSIPNKEEQKQYYQEQKKQTKWGYMLFDKEINIDSKLKELTKDSTIPITELKEFQRIYKEDSIAFATNQANTLNATNNANIESKTYLLGEEIEIHFKEQWKDKQIRFFSYLYKPHKDISADVELQEIHYTIIYDEDKEDKLFPQKDSSINWTNIAIEAISFIPLVRGVRITLNIGKWGLKLLRSKTSIPKKAKEYKSKKLVIKDNKKEQDKKSKTPPPIKEVKLDTLPKETQEAYHSYKAHKWQGTYPKQNHGVTERNEVRANKTFYNNDSILPIKPKGTYKEFDVINRHDPRRFVRDTKSGDVYYTTDHYKTFVKIIE